jgi:pimeloyl-ACP methyl ester carboxylesterase
VSTEVRVEAPGDAVRSIEIEVGPFTFDALEAGPSDGELVLLLHGFPQTGDQWRSQIEALSEAGYHAVAPNQRGYSPGARPDAVDEYTRDRLAEDVIGMADALGYDRFHLVGHDWGGAVSWETAARYPDRVGSVTVVSTPHPDAMIAALTSPENDQQARSSYILTFAEEGSEVRFLADDAALLRSFYENAGLSDEEMQPQLEVLDDPDAMRAALHWYRAAVQVGQAPTGPSTVPTMYVWSDGDTALGPDAAAATAVHVTGPYRFEVLEGVNHWIPEQAPDELNDLLLDFLTSQDPL